MQAACFSPEPSWAVGFSPTPLSLDGPTPLLEFEDRPPSPTETRSYNPSGALHVGQALSPSWALVHAQVMHAWPGWPRGWVAIVGERVSYYCFSYCNRRVFDDLEIGEKASTDTRGDTLLHTNVFNGHWLDLMQNELILA